MLKEVIGVMVATAALAGCAETKLVLKEGKGVDGMGNGVPEVSAVTTGSVALYSVKNLHERTNAAIDQACNPFRRDFEDEVKRILKKALGKAIGKARSKGDYSPNGSANMDTFNMQIFVKQPPSKKKTDQIQVDNKVFLDVVTVEFGKLMRVARDAKGAAAEVSDFIKTLRGWFPEHSVTYARKCFPDFNSTEAGD